MNTKIKWTFAGLGLFVLLLIVIALSFFVFMFITTGVEFFIREFRPETITPTKVEENTYKEEIEKIHTTTETIVVNGEEEETTGVKEVGEKAREKIAKHAPKIELNIYEDPTKVGDIYYIRIKADITGNPQPTIEFNRDDSKGAWGEDIAQVNLIPHAGYLLKATATNFKGYDSTNILLMIDENGNLIKSDKDINEDLIINDLAYIKIMCLPYTDDADPETDGISIDINFYNSNSENISFENIPITVNIKLYSSKPNWDTGEYEIVEPSIYEGIVKVDHSMRLSEMFGNYIKIPFENIGPLPDEESTMGISIVTLITPLQGSFGAREEWIPLEPY